MDNLYVSNRWIPVTDIRPADDYYNNCYSTGCGEKKLRGLIICDRNMQSFTTSTLKLLATAGLIDDSISRLGIYRYGRSPESTRDDVAKLLDTGRTNAYQQKQAFVTKVLYDQTGMFDDIAQVKSYEIRPAKTKLWRSQAYPHFDNIEIDAGRRESIRMAARMKAIQALSSTIMHDSHPECSPQYVQELVSGVTFGSVSLCLNENDMPTDDELEYGVYPEAAIRLVSKKYVDVDEETMTLIRSTFVVSNIMKIWKYAAEQSGAPICFSSAAPTAKSETIMDLGRVIGADSMMEAYLSGVPLDDIMA